MDQPSLVAIGISVVGGIFSLMWWLLRNKDEAQAKQIEILFSKHDKDYEDLQALKLEIAKRHYVKDELDTKFEKLEATFSSGFTSLGGKFDRLSEALINHQKEEVKG